MKLSFKKSCCLLLFWQLRIGLQFEVNLLKTAMREGQPIECNTWIFPSFLWIRTKANKNTQNHCAYVDPLINLVKTFILVQHKKANKSQSKVLSNSKDWYLATKLFSPWLI